MVQVPTLLFTSWMTGKCIILHNSSQSLLLLMQNRDNNSNHLVLCTEIILHVVGIKFIMLPSL